MSLQEQQAEHVGKKMMEIDRVSRHLGMELLEIRPGYSKMRLTVRDDMISGLGFCHGGITFTFAESAFAYACNSRNQLTVALSCNITFTTAVQVGDTLVAICEEQILNGRTGLYDATITNQKNEVVAKFRGNSYRTKGEVFPNLT
jgi:acyl-CoA thioesterase